MKTPEGKTVGKHIGLAFYTLGQRKGIGLGGSQAGSGDPWFVAGKDLANNTLIVVQGHQHPLLYSRTLQTQDTNWIRGELPDVSVTYGAKTRYRQGDATCKLDLKNNQSGLNDFSLDFNAQQWAITPGQSAVLYLNEVCLGGGIIV
jgi:tRNA-specific 2-thiouridylase